MAKYEDGCYGSASGIALIAKVLAGRCQMHYTRVAAGKGYMTDDESPKTMTEPPGYVMDAMIAGITNPVNGECQITVQINSENVETGFYCTSLLLYAEDPDEGEVPFTYLVLENEPEWIRPASSIVGKLATFDIIAAVGDVDAVTAAIDPEAIATVAEVERRITEHNADPDAHKAQIAEALDSYLVISAIPPAVGPALWFCTDRHWRPAGERVAVARLGDPAGAADAPVTAELNEIVYPVKNGNVQEKDGETVITIEQ